MPPSNSDESPDLPPPAGAPGGGALVWAGIAAAVLAIWRVDLTLPGGFAGGFPYIAVVLLGSTWLGPRGVVALALACAGLIGLGGLSAPEAAAGFPRPEAIERGCALGLLVAVTWLGLARREALTAAVLVERRFREFMEHCPALAFMKDGRGRYVFGNRAWRGQFAPDRDPIGRTDAELFGKEAARELRASDARVRVALRAGEDASLILDEFGVPSDGIPRWWRVCKFPLAGEGGAPLIGGFALDISESKFREEALRRGEALFRATFDQAGIGMAVLDPAGVVRRCNRAMGELLGRPPELLVGCPLDLLAHEEDAADARQTLGTALATGDRLECLMRFRREDGTIPWAKMTVSAAYDAPEAEPFAVGMFEDITERRKATEGLRIAKESAEAATRAKSEFLARLSHELRTPIAAIAGYSRKLREQPAPSAQLAEDIERITVNSEHVLRLADDLLNLSRIEAGAVDVRPIPCNLRELAADVAGTLEIAAQSKGLELVAEVGLGVPSSVVTDPVRLRQVLLNLLGNAVKYTDEGRVALAIEREGREIVFDVTDTGPGLSAEECSRLFEPFVQLALDPGRRDGGAGLGLSISKGLAQALGGDIEVESAPGRGCRFRVRLPLRSAAPRATGKGKTVPGPRPPAVRLPYRILVVDDSEDQRNLLGYYLRGAGAEVLAASNGEEALAVLDGAMAQGRGPHAILLDMEMPVMDGYETVRALRGRGIDLPVVAVSANTAERDRRACRDAGCDDHLAKPIDPAQLLVALSVGIKSGRAARGFPPS